MSKTRPAGGSADPIVEFFDRRAADYDREYAEDTPGGYALRVRRKKVLGLFDQPDGRVLDVGCGPGVMTQEMLNRGCSFWGVDPSSKMIEIARSRFRENEQTRFLQGEASRLQFAENVFDAVLCMGVIDSVPDVRLAIREMVRVLKPGGTLILTVANLLSPYAWWKNYAFHPTVAAWHRLRVRLGDPTMTPERIRSGGQRALYTSGEAHALVESSGATVLRTVPYCFNVFISPLDELMPRAALRVTRRLEEGKWAPPDWIAAGLILKARKI
jgi:ubiquinone/menaquinone biosynthesis C-methylase UbiE